MARGPSCGGCRTAWTSCFVLLWLAQASRESSPKALARAKVLSEWSGGCPCLAAQLLPHSSTTWKDAHEMKRNLFLVLIGLILIHVAIAAAVGPIGDLPANVEAEQEAGFENCGLNHAALPLDKSSSALNCCVLVACSL
eukprot:1722208-Amphidinium_carterae.2